MAALTSTQISLLQQIVNALLVALAESKGQGSPEYQAASTTVNTLMGQVTSGS